MKQFGSFHHVILIDIYVVLSNFLHKLIIKNSVYGHFLKVHNYCLKAMNAGMAARRARKGKKEPV